MPKRSEQLDAMPFGKRREQGMRRRGDEIDRSISKRGESLRTRKYVLEPPVETFIAKAAELDSGKGRKV